MGSVVHTNKCVVFKSKPPIYAQSSSLYLSTQVVKRLQNKWHVKKAKNDLVYNDF